MTARIAALLVLCAAAPAAAQQFPYTGYVTSDDVYARSGPGKNYYPSLKLERGNTVEVYRHDPGGWYAIRPPQGSFSWVAAKYIDVGTDGIGTVRTDRVVARVGTEFGEMRDVIQVQLDRGEELQVLEAVRVGSGAGAQTWYKVAPPAGEFRWVYGKFIANEPPQDHTQPRDASRNRLIADTPAFEQAEPQRRPPAEQAAVSYRRPQRRSGKLNLFEDPDVAPANYDQEFEGYDHPHPQSPPERIQPEVPAGSQYADYERGDDRDNPLTAPSGIRQTSYTRLSYEALPTARQPQPLPAPRPIARSRNQPTEPGAQNAELDAINEELSLIVSGAVSGPLAELEQDARWLLANAGDATVRARARRVVMQCERFADIRRRSQRLGTERPVAPTQPQAGITQASTADSRFDGTGKLTPVVSQNIGTPRFALVDERGGIRCYVTPAPGVSMRRYLGQQVGVNGTRGYIPELSAHHVTARHVVLLEGSRTLY